MSLKIRITLWRTIVFVFMQGRNEVSNSAFRSCTEQQ
jgi:hypothetical protein